MTNEELIQAAREEADYASFYNNSHLCDVLTALADALEKATGDNELSEVLNDYGFPNVQSLRYTIDTFQTVISECTHLSKLNYKPDVYIERIKAIAFEKAEPKWIPVSERLPKTSEPVLVWEKAGFAFVDNLVAGTWVIGDENFASITHWMPLPDPPKEEENEPLH